MLKISYTIAGAALSVLLLVFASLSALSLRYPLDYRDQILLRSKANGLSAELVAAVIWTESKYDALAVSAKGARGLMQLMPSTAKWCALEIGLEYSDEMLFDPDYNIELGTFYLAYLMNKFGDETLAVAAYNAGEGKVASWIKQNLEEIPFPETDMYVKRVRTAKNVYKARFRNVVKAIE